MAQDLLNTPTNKVLISMSLPISIGMLSTLLFQVIDTYFVSKLGAEELTALGFASTIYFLLVGLYIGLSIAVSIIIGKAVGENNHQDARTTATLSLFISFFIAVILSFIGIQANDWLFEALGATTPVLQFIGDYMQPLYWGMPVLAAGIVGGSVLRTNGIIKAPEIIFAIGGIINAFLDYAFIFGKFGFPALGIQGVAYGTVSSWVFIFLLVLLFLFKHKFLAGLRLQRSLIVPIFTYGLPSITTQLVGPATLLFITYLLGRIDAHAVAAYGVAGRIETLMMIGVMAISTAITPFIAQNLGAKKVDRIDQAIVFGGKSTFYLGALVMLILFLFIRPIAGLFSDEESIILHTSYYFYLVGASYIFYGLYIITGAIFNGLQFPAKALKVMLVKTLAFTFPIAAIGSLWGVHGVFAGIAISNVLGGFYARFEMRKELKRVNSELVKVNAIQDLINDIRLWFKFNAH